MTAIIYSLADPRTGMIRYVGKTIDLGARVKTHLRAEKTHKGRWVQSLRALGLYPVAEILDIVPEAEWQWWEQHWISMVRSWGFDLTNGDNGGQGSGRLNQEVKDKISATLRGRAIPKLHKPIYQYDLNGVFIAAHPSITAAATSVNGAVGNIVRAAYREAISHGYRWSRLYDSTLPALPKRACSDMTRERLRKINTGKRTSEETRAKQSEARMGVPPANKGVAMTPEMKANYQSVSTVSHPVDQLDFQGALIATYPSVKAAAESVGTHRYGIKRVIDGKQKHAANFLWRYANA